CDYRLVKWCAPAGSDNSVERMRPTCNPHERIDHSHGTRGEFLLCREPAPVCHSSIGAGCHHVGLSVVGSPRRWWEAAVSANEGEVRFRLLGPLEVVKDGADYAPTAPKVMQLLAMLLMRPGKTVHTELILEELWSDDPPRSVRSTLQTYVYQLRRCIEQNKLAPDGEALLLTRRSGYVFRIDPPQTDVYEFHQLHARGRRAMDEHRYADAAD